MSIFKNITDLGLKIFTIFDCPTKTSFIAEGDRRDAKCNKCAEVRLMVSVHELESLLSQGVRVQRSEQLTGGTRAEEGKRYWLTGEYKNAKYEALLINVRPVEKPDTAESLLRELLSFIDASLVEFHGLERYKERARWLLK